VRKTRVWARLLGLQRAVVEDVQIGDEEELVVAVRPTWRQRDWAAPVLRSTCCESWWVESLRR
jgi:hypothetical protein